MNVFYRNPSVFIFIFIFILYYFILYYIFIFQTKTRGNDKCKLYKIETKGLKERDFL
jgi:phosphotransferase system  glucose/maltose/N-acetylglucosamine-specific IIC component